MAEKLSSKRYELSIDLDNKNSSHTLIVELTGSGKKVLDVGASTGYLSRILKDEGNFVIGVEIDKEAAELAKECCDLIIVGDIEVIELNKFIENSSIDVIILGDVLEHLKSPENVLEKIKKYLKPNGYLVVSLPNICHGDVLLNLICGNFKYTPTGLLDVTHLRFFGFKNIVHMFNKCGYYIADLHKVVVPMGNTEQKIDLNKIPIQLFKFIEVLPNSNVYQFVFKAIPCQNLSNETIPDINIHKIFDNFIKNYPRKLENEFLDLGIKYQKSLENITKLTNIIQHKDLEIKTLELQKKNLELQKKNLESIIQSIQQSITWRFIMKFHKLIERLPPGLKNMYYKMLLTIRNI